jgi:outer membrane receptor protein involved in Fe transport
VTVPGARNPVIINIKKTTMKIPHGIIACTLLAWGTPALAGVAGDTTSSRVLDEVIILSTKETSPAGKVPASITTLAAPVLEREGVHALKQVAARVPNFYMPDYGSALNSPVYIRGIGTRAGSPAVGLYVDGIPYLESMAFDLRLLDVERVEITRGPQGTLHGRNTMAGIIDITTRSPLQQQGTRAGATAGSHRLAGASVTSAARPRDGLGISAGIDYRHRDGFRVNLHDGRPSGTRDELAARARLVARHGARASSDLHLYLEHGRQRGYPYGRVDSTGVTGPVNHDEPSSYTRALLTAGYRFTLHDARGTLQAIAGYQWLDDRQAVDQDFSPARLFYAVQEQSQHALTVELVARSPVEGRYRRVTGLFAFARQVEKQVDVTMHAAGVTSSATHELPARGVALYHQSTLHDLLLPGLSVTAGARLDHERARQRYSTATTTTDATLPSLEFLPRIAARFERHGHSLYLSLAKGYKTGGFNATFTGPDDQTFDPESSWNHEAGFHLRLPGNTSLDASLFYIDWRRQQITQIIVLPSGGSGSQTRNAGRSRSKGFEVSITSSPLPGLELELHHGFIDARFKDYLYDPAKGTRYDGHRVPHVPGHTLSAAATYQLPVARRYLDRVLLHARLDHAGRIYWHEDNAASQPPRGLLDAALTLDRGPATLALRAANILSTRHDLYRFDINMPGLSATYAQPGRPFTLEAELSFTF